MLFSSFDSESEDVGVPGTQPYELLRGKPCSDGGVSGTNSSSSVSMLTGEFSADGLYNFMSFGEGDEEDDNDADDADDGDMAEYCEEEEEEADEGDGEYTTGAGVLCSGFRMTSLVG